MRSTFREQDQLLSRVLARLETADRFTHALQCVLGACIGTVGADGAALVLLDEDSARSYEWRARPSRRPHDADVVLTEPAASDLATFFFDTPEDAVAWHPETRSDGTPATRVLRVDGRIALEDRDAASHLRLLARLAADRCIVVSAQLASWRVRFVLIDPRRCGSPQIRFLRRFSDHIAAPLYSHYLLARRRSRVIDVERARIARELHDGLIQSLIGLEMGIDALRRRLAPSPLESEFVELRDRLHQSILDTRDLMAELRSPLSGQGDLLERAVSIVDRFRTETGIDVHFTWDVDEFDCHPRASTEVARILQEALINIRKHAGARHVVVRFDRNDHDWTLHVDDDGRGFAFAGTFAHDELDRLRRGPLVIKERVRAIGGELTVHSDPGRGACLEMRWPSRGRSLVEDESSRLASAPR